MEALFVKLLNISITASWMALAVIVLRLFLKKTPKFITVLMWALVGIRLLIPFSIESNLSLVPDAEPIVIEDESTADTSTTDNVYIPPAADNDGIITIPPVGNTETDVPTVTPPQTQVQTQPVADKNEAENNIADLLAKVWLGGIGLMLIYAAVSYMRVKHTVREAMHLNNRVWVGDSIATPFILGTIRPKVYLPSSLSKDDMGYVIAHETSHIKRGDHLWKPLGFLLLAVYWYNPLLWVSYILLCRDIELAADEKVIKSLGEECKKPYSHALINCSVHRKLISVCPLAFGEVAVKSRIKSVLNYKKPTFWVIIAAVALCVTATLLFMTNPKDNDGAKSEESKESAEESSGEESDEAIEGEGSDITATDSEGIGESTEDATSEEESDSSADVTSEEISNGDVESAPEEESESKDGFISEDESDVFEDSDSSAEDTSDEESESGAETSSEAESTSEAESDSEAESTSEAESESEAESTPEEESDSVTESTPEDEKPIVGQSFVCVGHFDYTDNFWLDAVNNLYITAYRGFEPIHRIGNLEELSRFKASYLVGGGSFDKSFYHTPSLNQSTEGLDDTFFEDYDLYLCYFHGPDMYKAGDVLISGDGKDATFTYELCEKGNNVTKSYFLGVPVLKAYSKSFESFKLTYRVKTSFYIPTADPDGFVVKEAYHAPSAVAIIDTLVAEGALPAGCKSISCWMMNNVITVNMEAGFEELVCGNGSYTEYYSIGSLVNTLIRYYGEGNATQPEGVIIKVDGKPLNTNLFGQIRDPLTFFEDREFEGNPPPTAQEKPVVGTWRFYHANFMDREFLYANALNQGAISPLLRFDSVEDIERLQAKSKNSLSFHGSYGSVPNVSTELGYCDEKFFEDYSMFVLYIINDSAYKYEITAVTITADGSGIDISYDISDESHEPEGNYVCWALTVPVLKSAIADCQNFTASYDTLTDAVSIDGAVFLSGNYPNLTTVEETKAALEVMSSFLIAVHKGDSTTYNSLAHQDYINRAKIFAIDSSFVDQTPIMFLPPEQYKNRRLPLGQIYSYYYNQGAAPVNDGMRHVLFSIYVYTVGNEYIFDMVFDSDGNCTVYNFGEENLF